MLIHIVRNNESVRDILNCYHLVIDDLKSANLHITDFDHLCPGTILKIPMLNEEMLQTLEQTEPFVNDYHKDFINKQINEENEQKMSERVQQNNLEANENIPNENKINESPEIKEGPRNLLKDGFKGVKFIRPKGISGILPKRNPMKQIYPHFQGKKEK